MLARFTDALVLLLATGLGVGYSRWAPGTVGSLWGPPLVWGMQAAGMRGMSWALVSVLIVLAGVPICSRAAELMGRKDPGSVVWDEVAAFPLVFAGTTVTWMTALLGYLLFRLFDIVKPWPVRRLERLPSGWGIMADDLMAGLYAGGCLWLLARFAL